MDLKALKSYKRDALLGALGAFLMIMGDLASGPCVPAGLSGLPACDQKPEGTGGSLSAGALDAAGP